MEEKEYLNEERYQKNRKKIARISLIVLVIGCLIGGSLIVLGVVRNKNVSSKYSSESRAELTKQIETEKKKLEKSKEELEEQGVEYNAVAKYTDGKAYELKLITNVLDPSFDYYKFDEYQNNSVTAKYCSLMLQNDENKSGFNRNHEIFKNAPLFMFGTVIIISSIMFAGSIYMMSKRREIMAFQTQQVMPVAQEGMEKMAPSVAKVGKAMAEEMAPVYKDMAKEIAPVYGEIAKEIAKGVKEGMKDDDNKS